MDGNSQRLARADDVLDSCVEQRTPDAAEQVLRQYPHLAPRLRPLVHVASGMRELGKTEMPELAKARGREQLRRAVLRERRRRSAHVLTGRFGPAMMRTAAWAALVIALLGAGVTGLSFAAARSTPGDPLYGLKQTTERLWGGAPTFAAALGEVDRQIAAITERARSGQPLPASTAVELRRAYAAALAASAAEPSAARQEQLRQLQDRGAQDSALFDTLAAQAAEPERSILRECAAAAQWLATAARDAEAVGPSGTVAPAP